MLSADTDRECSAPSLVLDAVPARSLLRPERQFDESRRWSTLEISGAGSEHLRALGSGSNPSFEDTPQQLASSCAVFEPVS